MVAPKPHVPSDLDELVRDFAEKLAHVTDFPNINNAKLHLKQQMFYRALEKARIFQAGNQAGKSFVGYHEDACWLTNRHAHNPRANAGAQHGRVIVPDFNHGADEIAVPNLARLIPPSYLIDGSWDRSYSKADHKLHLINGSTCEIMSQEQDVDAFAGTQRDFVHADEEVEKERWDESMIRLIRRDGYWWVTQTPVAGVEWIWDDYIKPLLDGIAGVGPMAGSYRNSISDKTRGVLLITASIWDNAVSRGGVLPDEAIERLLSGMSPEDRRVREYGVMPEMGGAAFPEFNRSTHVIETNDHRLEFGEFVIPSDARIYTTMDDGRMNPTAWLWVAAMNDGHLVTFHEHYQAGWNLDKHVEVVKAFEDRLQRPIFMRVGDPAIGKKTTIGTSVLIEYAREMRRLGMRSPGIAINAIPQDRRIHRAKVHQYFQIDPRTQRAFWEIMYDCPWTIKEISGLKNDGWINRSVAKRNNRKEGIRDHDNHTYDATKYLASIMPDITPQRLEDLTREAQERMLNVFEREFDPGSERFSVDNVGMLDGEDRADDDWMSRSYD